MYRAVVKGFGGIDQLALEDSPMPVPGPGEVLVRLTSIGMNHAELMARRGQYRLVSGNPPFIPGLEGGGIITAVGEGVDNVPNAELRRSEGQRVVLSLDAPASRGLGQGTYQSHYVVAADKTVLAPEAIPDEWLGALWLPFLTAWGCLVWRQNMQPGDRVLIPAASSSVAIAASQVVKYYGGLAVGTTTRPEKVSRLAALPEARFDHIVVTQEPHWWREAKKLTEGKGFNIIFDPVAAGEFLNQEIRLLAPQGTLWIYGLLGQPDTVNVTPLIRKMASLRGWLLNEIVASGSEQGAYRHILDRVADGTYALPVAQTFSLRDVQQAHTAMETGNHIGKLILVP
ncbi:MAG: zinc-binding dehydrogenase [Leptolyngbya sp. SIOISBB]|nr:zinc-binding dehydrogenase [Leptolyngbya sp. SIOISBB]